MLRDRARMSQVTATGTRASTRYTGGRSFFPTASDGERGGAVAAYIMATGGAGSSGLPALESGKRTSSTANPKITRQPIK